MPINVFGNSLKKSEKKIDTSLFVQKTFSRRYYLESIIEDDIDLKKQNNIKKLHCFVEILDAVRKS